MWTTRKTEKEIEDLCDSLKSVAAFDTLSNYESVSKKVTLQFNTDKRIKDLNDLLNQLQDDVAAISTSVYRTFLKGPEHTSDTNVLSSQRRVLSPNSVQEIVGSIRHVWFLRRAFSGTSPKKFFKNVRARVTAVNRPMVWIQYSGALDLAREEDVESQPLMFNNKISKYYTTLLNKINRNIDGELPIKTFRQIRVDAPRSGLMSDKVGVSFGLLSSQHVLAYTHTNTHR